MFEMSMEFGNNQDSLAEIENYDESQNDIISMGLVEEDTNDDNNEIITISLLDEDE